MPLIHIVVGLALAQFVFFCFAVGKARGTYKVPAPATTGNEMFERYFRVQMNTLEQMALFLPALWLYAAYVSDRGAAIGGLIWVVGRVIYALAYTKDPTTRGPGAMITLLASAGLWLGAVYGVVRALI